MILLLYQINCISALFNDKNIIIIDESSSSHHFLDMCRSCLLPCFSHIIGLIIFIIIQLYPYAYLSSFVSLSIILSLAQGWTTASPFLLCRIISTSYIILWPLVSSSICTLVPIPIPFLLLVYFRYSFFCIACVFFRSSYVSALLEQALAATGRKGG